MSRARRQGVARAVHGLHAGVGAFGGEGQRDDPGARAHVDAAGVVGQRQLEDQLHQPLGFRPRHERAAVAEKLPPVELHRAEQVLERLALRTAFDELAQGVEFLVVQWPVEHHVQVHPPLDAQDVGEEQVDVEPRTLDAPVREIFRGGFEDFEDGLHQRAAGMGSLDQPARERKAAMHPRLAPGTVSGQQ